MNWGSTALLSSARLSVTQWLRTLDSHLGSYGDPPIEFGARSVGVGGGGIRKPHPSIYLQLILGLGRIEQNVLLYKYCWNIPCGLGCRRSGFSGEKIFTAKTRRDAKKYKEVLADENRMDREKRRRHPRNSRRGTKSHEGEGKNTLPLYIRRRLLHAKAII